MPEEKKGGLLKYLGQFCYCVCCFACLGCLDWLSGLCPSWFSPPPLVSATADPKYKPTPGMEAAMLQEMERGGALATAERPLIACAAAEAKSDIAR